MSGTRRAATGAKPQQQSAAKKGWGFQGKDVRAQSEVETQKAKDKAKSAGLNRFRLNKGESAEIIILDMTFDDMFGMYEHEIWPQTEKFPTYEVSPITGGQEDPLEHNPCVNGEPSKPYYVVYATILDLRPYKTKDKDGNEVTVPYSRKLMPIKNFQCQQFSGLSDDCVDDFGSFRGVHMRMVRPDGNGISSRIGDPAPLKTKFGFFTDDQLIKQFGHPAIKSSKDNKVIIPANGKLQPFDYQDIFHVEKDKDGEPDWVKHAEYLRRKYRIGAVMGSRQEEEETWNQAVEEDTAPQTQYSSEDLLVEDDIPF